MATETKTLEREELIETILDCVNQGTYHSCEQDHYGNRPDVVAHGFLSAYEAAFDVLDRLGRLEWMDEKHYWARLIWEVPEDGD